MNKDLTEKLYTKYPKLFAQHKQSPEETSTCWGLQCGDGWYKIIEILCNQLTFDIKQNEYPQLEFTTVKEKFGGLRLYYTYGEKDASKKYTDKILGSQEGMITLTERLSYYVCEKCGSMKDVKQTQSACVQSLCKKCRE